MKSSAELMQVRSIRLALDDLASKMDKELTELATKRFSSAKRTLELEVKAVLIGSSAERLSELGEVAAHRVLLQMSSMQELKQHASALHQEMQKKVCADTCHGTVCSEEVLYECIQSSNHLDIYIDSHCT